MTFKFSKFENLFDFGINFLLYSEGWRECIKKQLGSEFTFPLASPLGVGLSKVQTKANIMENILKSNIMLETLLS